MREPAPLTILLSLALLIGLARLSVVNGAEPFPGTLPGVEIGMGLPAVFEPSGAVWHPRLAKLLVVSDGGQVAMLDEDGAAVTTWDLPGDLEAITVADPEGPFVYVGGEDPDSVLEFDLDTGSVTRTFDLTGTMTGPNSRGLEALTFVEDPAHPEGGLFFAGLQDDGRIYVFDLPIRSSATSTAVEHVATFAPVPGRDDLSGLVWLGASAQLYAIYDSYDLVRAMRTNGTFLDEWILPGATQEGIAVHGCSLFVADDTPAAVRRYTFPVDTADADGDGLLDCLDNCPETPNPLQADADADGAGDVCDCAPGDASAAALPGEVTGLRLTRAGGRIELSWTESEANYDVAGGLVADMLRDGSFAAASCLQDDVTGHATFDTVPAPEAGQAHYYIVRGQNVCGTGSYGRSSDGIERTMPGTCP